MLHFFITSCLYVSSSKWCSAAHNNACRMILLHSIPEMSTHAKCYTSSSAAMCLFSSPAVFVFLVSMGNSLHLQSKDFNSEELRSRNRRNHCGDKASRTMNELAACKRSVHHDALTLEDTLSSSPSSEACGSIKTRLLSSGLEILFGKGVNLLSICRMPPLWRIQLDLVFPMVILNHSACLLSPLLRPRLVDPQQRVLWDQTWKYCLGRVCIILSICRMPPLWRIQLDLVFPIVESLTRFQLDSRSVTFMHFNCLFTFLF